MHKHLKGMPIAAMVAVVLAAAAVARAGDSAATRSEASRTPLQLKVVGTKLLDSQNRPARLLGVNTASMEWTSDGEGHILETVKVAVEGWHANHVRLPLTQDRWFGKTSEQSDEGKSYRDLVRQIVDYCASRGCYVVLDLHWSDAGEWGKYIAQRLMPDENSLAFWKDVAGTYKNHPAVLFDLYNEPHNVTWEIWRDGGMVSERDRRAGMNLNYRAVGLQQLLDAVRETGAQNVVVAGGLDWSYDYSGILGGKALRDPKGNGVLYANHAYPVKRESVEKWVERMRAAEKEIAVIVSEFGTESRADAADMPNEWSSQVLKALHEHGWSWTAWDMHVAAGPRLILDWKYTPTPSFGALVRQSLLDASKAAGSTPPSEN